MPVHQNKLYYEFIVRHNIYVLFSLQFDIKQKYCGTQLSTWTKRGGFWTDAWFCLYYWMVIGVAG